MAARSADPPPLREVLAALESIAPPELAAAWDNVGLLLEPKGRSRARVGRVLLAIDLTAPVLAECRRRRADLLVCYHPPIFEPLRRLSDRDPRQRLLLEAARAGLAVYSPHTALDAAPGGVNDWLAERVATGARGVSFEPCGEDGFGRLVRFSRPLGLQALVTRVKRALRLARVRIAGPPGRRGRVRSVAVCAGAGGSVLAGVLADALVTGEMRHHDVLAAVEGGAAVVLCEHSNTERPYLKVLRTRLARALGGRVDVAVCRADREPLRPA
jgi:dinuclear metal center YbgI/SA1388 family protein